MVKSLYAISDTHDDLEALARAVDFAKSENLPGSRIVHIGDLAMKPYTKEDLDSVIETKDLQTFIGKIQSRTYELQSEYKKILDSSGMPYTVIPGNYDSPLGRIFEDKDIHNKSVSWDGIKVVGYGGGGNLDDAWIGQQHMEIVMKLGQIQMFNGRELKELLENNNPSIAVVHNPPYGLCDDMFNGEHAGTPTLRKHIEKDNKLKLVFSGHIHEAGPNANNPNRVNGISGIVKGNKKVIVVNPGNLGRFEILNPQTLDAVRKFDYGTFVRVDIESDGTPKRVKQYSVQENTGAIGKVREIGDFAI